MYPRSNNSRPRYRRVTHTLAILACSALAASAPVTLGQSEQNKSAAQPAAPGTLRFPIAGGDGAVDLTWTGGDEVRAGQDFEYSLRVTNSSRTTVHNVVIHQALPGSIQISKSSPQPEQGGQAAEQSQQGKQQQQPPPQQQSGQQQPSAQAAEPSQQGKQQQQPPPPQQSGQQQPSAQAAEQSQQGKQQQQPPPQQQSGQQQPSAQAAEQSQQGKQQQQPPPQQQGGQQQPSAQAAEQSQQGKQQQQPQQNGQAGSQQQATQQQGDQQQGDQNTQILSWRLGALDPGQTKTVRVTASAQNAGSFDACAWVSFLPTLCREIKVTQPELRLTQWVVDANGNPRDLFYACETVFVRYRLTNTGSGATSPAVIVSSLPQGLLINGERDLRLQVGRVSPGETVERTVRLEPTQPGVLSVRGQANTGELEAMSNSSQVRIVKPELALKVQAPRRTYLGRSVTYQISVTNTSNVPALNTVVQMPAPAGGLRFVSNDQEIPQEVDRYQIGRLGPGETRTFGVTFDPSEVGTIGTTATASAYCADAVTKKIATEIAGVPAVQISVIDRQDPIKVGENTVYEVQVINEGSAEDLNIQLSGQLQGPLQFVEGTGETRVSGQGQTIQFGPIDRLPPGEVASWLVTVKGSQAGSGKLQLKLRTKATPGAVTSSEPTTVY